MKHLFNMYKKNIFLIKNVIQKCYLFSFFNTNVIILEYYGASPFDGGVFRRSCWVVKKKDVSNQTYFHDLVRKSFDAELKRLLQRMQEQEWQKII